MGGGAARLTLPHLAKDDEGLYTLRIFTKDGTTEHSAYLFVSGRKPPASALGSVKQRLLSKYGFLCVKPITGHHGNAELDIMNPDPSKLLTVYKPEGSFWM